MNGDFKHVWRRLWSELWVPLAENRRHPELLFADIYRGLKRPPVPPVEPERPDEAAFDADGNLTARVAIAAFESYQRSLEEYQLARSNYDLAATGKGSRDALRNVVVGEVESELASLVCLSKTYTALVDLEEPELLVRFKRLVGEAIDTYNLGYRLVDPFILAPTVPGVISRLFQEMKRLSSLDAHLRQLCDEYEESCIDLSSDPTPGRIKNCIQKQFIFVEGVGKRTFNVNGTTLGAICDQVNLWPHVTLKEIGKKLYGFRSDYPGLGHAGNPDAVLREVDLKDFVALSCLLAGLYPYMHAQIDPAVLYRG
ncbi:hypothetical protein SAMN04515648_0952 [Phyllobacterium sp. CL33Tsu]|uniref:hypothetical protein n=1 Tax=Phyllobacterium sp. CL33Tsu TaxID=1798191 RepID=UPI0008DF031B|nr:hypothetical protein [Phyllobacterium sp. CL33Tsu]SFI64622.1 hypothetical protein SAMN04515648_0952 [Phyllobacterium sp. CL33Tsu]